MSLWSAQDAAQATGGIVQGDWQASGVSIDTRTLVAGDLFVALTDSRDGHDFVAAALRKGAAAAIVSRVPEGVGKDAPLLLVPDVLEALADLGRAGRARTGAKVVAVTGSVGKTSTKEMLRVVLERQGETHAAEASYNNQWGVPLTLARMPVDTEFAIIEIGMNHPGEIAPLAKLARPHVAMITTIAPAHLEAFDDITGIALEKSMVFQGLEQGGACIVNGDIETKCLMLIEGEARANGGTVFRFGEDEACEYRLSHVELTGDATIIQAVLPSGAQLMRLSCLGRHFAANALGVLAVVEALGADVTLAARDVSFWRPPSGRGTAEIVVLDPVEGLSLTLFDDAFNANPTSVVAALEVLAATGPGARAGGVGSGRRIAILGDMLELGGDEVQMHRDLATNTWMQAVDLVHCVGPLMQETWQALDVDKQGVWLASVGEILPRIPTLITSGDVVLVKGSKGSKVSDVVDAIRRLGHPLRDATREGF